MTALWYSITYYRITRAMKIPPLLSAFGCYPNPLNFTEEDRCQFHPVVVFPPSSSSSSRPQKSILVSDHTKPVSRDGPRQLATEEEWQTAKQERQKEPSGSAFCRDGETDELKDATLYSIGRYDENRVGMYESDLFISSSPAATTTDEATKEEGENRLEDDRQPQKSQRRTVHLGIELGGPVGTPVYAFWDGIVSGVGYNDRLGDYGRLIIVKHEFPSSLINEGVAIAVADYDDDGDDEKDHPPRQKRILYALYGHLNTDVMKLRKGLKVKRGQMLGRIGDITENGGWYSPHVHFQLSLSQPEMEHDMPGTCTLGRREFELQNYIDPRYVLGELY